MEPVFKIIPGFKIVGMMYSGRVDTGEIPLLWNKFADKMETVPNRINEHKCFGIINPFGENKSKGEIDYVAAVEVENFNDVPDDMISADIPEGEYAIFTHVGPISNIMNSVKYIYGEWLPNSEYTLTGMPDLEVYDERFKLEAEDSECDICLSVKKK